VARVVVHVVPRSSKPGPDGWHDGVPRLRVSAPPADGKANDEAVRLLSDILCANVRLVAGAKSRRKVFEVNVNDLDRRIVAIFG